MPREPFSVSLTRILHASVLIEGGDQRILVDPCFGAFLRRTRRSRLFGIRMPEPARSPGDLDATTIIAMTHDHEDHFDRAGLAAIPSRRARVIVPTASQARRVRRLGFEAIDVIGRWETITFGDIRLTAVPARAPNAFLEISFVIEIGGLRILHAGDTAFHPRFDEIRERCSPDVGLLPVSGTSLAGIRLTMTPVQAAWAVNSLALRVAIPIHDEMRFGGISSFLYRAPGSSEEFASIASRIAPATKIVVAPRGRAIDLTSLLEESPPDGYSSRL